MSRLPHELYLDLENGPADMYINDQGDAVLVKFLDNSQYTHKIKFVEVAKGSSVRKGKVMPLSGTDLSILETAEQMLIIKMT